MQVESISALESYKVTIVLEEVSKHYVVHHFGVKYLIQFIHILITFLFIVCKKAVIPGFP